MKSKPLPDQTLLVNRVRSRSASNLASRTAERRLPRHSARQPRPRDLLLGVGTTALPRVACEVHRSMRLAMRRVLLDDESFPSGRGDARAESIQGNARPEWRLRKVVQLAARLRRPPLPAPIPRGSHRERSPHAGGLQIRSAEPGTSATLTQSGGVALEQLPGDGGPRPATAFSRCRFDPLLLRKRRGQGSPGLFALCARRSAARLTLPAMSRCQAPGRGRSGHLSRRRRCPGSGLPGGAPGGRRGGPRRSGSRLRCARRDRRRGPGWRTRPRGLAIRPPRRRRRRRAG